MRKVIVSFKLKDILVGFIIFNLFIIILSVTIMGKNKGNDSKVVQKNESVPKVESKSTNSKDEKNEKKEILKNKIDSKVNIYLSKDKKVVQLDIEDYIIGVVSAEMPANFGEEALKAQAVAARTYTVAHLKSIFKGGCNLNQNADLCDTVHCQAYINKEKRLNSWPKSQRLELYKKVEQAVKDTKGEVLSYNDELVMNPYYFAVSSGNTENSEDVFAKGAPYLKSVESPGEEIAPKFKKEFSFSKNEFINSMKTKFPNLKIDSNNIEQNIQIISRSNAGSISQIKIGNTVTTGKVVRSIMGLTSSNFKVSFQGNHIKFSCKGYGHGVGMSQWGASVMAKEGKKYNEILNHYYSGTSITKLKYK
ncbi:stage II sporulation protein D [Hathewaya histolytica]|uniref:Stage II sporulation protein D n=1 Tax=Hathewaya histolytica TaxID=1498 RepID=A0A4U9RSZ6_HATHI|nr:stage II sporulation protein D [Hathewaya histolytica]VTQ94093.1 stage II sporulation protein D [Hathewaya histolytica]